VLKSKPKLYINFLPFCPTSSRAIHYYVGNHYEVTNGVATKYYYFGKQRIAMRTTAGVVYLHSDHLGSTSATSGASVSSQTYYAYGNIRSTTGTAPTDFGFTGQKRDASAGLLFYNARYYDPTIGRFVSADSIVPSPGNPQTLNRYAYAYNNPLRYNDPTGHDAPDIINFLGEFSTGAANEAWYNIAWFIPAHEALQVQAGESDAMMAGRVFGDVIAIGVGVGEMAGGVGIFGGGAAACGTVVLCLAGAPAMAVGATVAGSGAWTTGTAMANGANNLNNLIARASANDYRRRFEQSMGRRQLPDHDLHHGFPKAEEFSKFFKRLGIDVHDPKNLYEIPRPIHQQTYKGLTFDESWNGLWRAWIAEHPKATLEQVIEFRNLLANDFGIEQYLVKLPGQ
jgi:RHS repeat-associated protein